MNVYRGSGNPRLIEYLPENAHTALDLGCASGGMAETLNALGIQTDGVTYSAEEKRLAEQHCRKVIEHNLEDGLPLELASNSYDVIILSHVLEHIADPKKLLEGISQALGPNGRILCAIPNMLFFKNRLKLLAGKIEYQDRGLMDYTHVRWYTRASLEQLFESYGFETLSFNAQGNVPLGPMRSLVSANFAQALDTFFIRLAPSWFAWEYSFSFCFKE